MSYKLKYPYKDVTEFKIANIITDMILHVFHSSIYLARNNLTESTVANNDRECDKEGGGIY